MPSFLPLPRPLHHRPRTAGRRALARATAVAGLMAVASACVPPPPPVPTTSCVASPPQSATEYQKLFDVRSTEAAAADIWSPTTVGARTVWFLGDTFVGRQKSPGVLDAGYGFVHNAVQVQSDTCLESLLGGRAGARTDWFLQPNATDYYWPAGTFLDGATLKIVLLLIRPYDRPGDTFDFYVAGVRIATLGSDRRPVAIERPTALADTTSPDTFNIPFGSATVQDGSYLYLYGSARTSELEVSNYVARTTAGAAVSGPWEYWTGVDWSPDPAELVPMQIVGNAPLSQLRVIRYGSGWLAVAKMVDGYTEDVTAWFSSAPTGPWQRVPTTSGDGRIGTTPRASDSDLVYGAALVNLPGAGWTVMWNVNTSPGSNIASNIWLYGPKFAAPANLPSPDVLFPTP